MDAPIHQQSEINGQQFREIQDSAKRVVQHAGNRAHDGRHLAIGDVFSGANWLCNKKVNQPGGERRGEDPDDPCEAEVR